MAHTCDPEEEAGEADVGDYPFNLCCIVSLEPAWATLEDLELAAQAQGPPVSI